jgi:hypothetical protein
MDYMRTEPEALKRHVRMLRDTHQGARARPIVRFVSEIRSRICVVPSTIPTP